MAINIKNKEYFRPWGSYITFDQEPGFQVKRLNVNPGESCLFKNITKDLSIGR